ncbi:protein geranylgeranyltransferase type I beta subunit [Syncephalastrum racemosum]|uniref:Geranylgeranyl transferase type-1 subunit beta n=1 Tax=Syncephalastrum racemosum TaxID=13706 RepID=A0A1X2H3K4_SYNRA|nr:protein geranylgeranyltransferase type I beta subunit [Syncephalastrum racemosum]
MAEATPATINFGKHVKYFVANLTMLPTAYTETETNRMTLAFFCLASLELLGALETAVSERNRSDWIEWIYAQQIKPAPDGSDLNRAKCGFRGASWSGRPFDSHATTSDYIPYDSGHITNTYTALISLLILGDDLSRVDRDAIVESIRCMQQPDGSLGPTEESLERDARFFFSACAVSYILNDWRGLDLDQCIHYARQLQTYEGTFGQQPHMEAHGGSTFCGVAALTLMGKQEQGIINKDKLIRWCLSRQTTGFAGRPNKDADACYCFWIGAALTMLDAFQLTNQDNLREFLAQCQTDFGGFGKAPGARPDLMHSYMGVAALSLMGEPGIGRLDVAVNAPATAMARLKEQCVFWS